MTEKPEAKKDVYRPSWFTAVVGAILGLLTVLVLILVMVWVSRPAPAPPAADEPQPRTVEQVRAEEIRLLTGYGWVDREEGIVRIPVERAMELTIAESGGPGEAGLRQAERNGER